MPAQSDIVQRCTTLACEAHCEIILIFANGDRVIEYFWLVPLQPQRFWDHPFRGNRSLTIAVQNEALIACLQYGLGFLVGAHIHPHQRRAQRCAILVKCHNRAACSGIGHCIDSITANIRLFQADLRCCNEAGPPVFRILLRPRSDHKFCFIGLAM